MVLYLARHGEAKSAEQDPERSLTEGGAKAVQEVASALARLKPGVRAIWHSGKRRAEQTATLFADALAEGGGARIAPQARPDLEPGAPPRGILGQLRILEHDLLIVGHLPHLARLATALIVGRQLPQALDLEAGALVCLERTGGAWALRWLLTPELCR